MPFDGRCPTWTDFGNFRCGRRTTPASRRRSLIRFRLRRRIGAVKHEGGGSVGWAICLVVSVIVGTVKSRMPIENEWKFVLENDGKLEPRLAQAPGVTRGLDRPSIPDASGVRFRSVESGGKRHHIFTYKRSIDGEVVEIETYISAG